ncbi:MAG TPA: hypothetical protein VGB17_18110, partial [Pyrinomonadaceae bacterium]
TITVAVAFTVTFTVSIAIAISVTIAFTFAGAVYSAVWRAQLSGDGSLYVPDHQRETFRPERYRRDR